MDRPKNTRAPIHDCSVICKLKNKKKPGPLLTLEEKLAIARVEAKGLDQFYYIEYGTKRSFLVDILQIDAPTPEEALAKAEIPKGRPKNPITWIKVY